MTAATLFDTLPSHPGPCPICHHANNHTPRCGYGDCQCGEPSTPAFDGPGAFHHDDPATSRAAATNPANVVRFGTDRHNLLLAFSLHSDLTPDEAGELAHVTGYNPRRRASDLLRSGYLEPVGYERNGCRVLRITDAGRRALAAAGKKAS